MKVWVLVEVEFDESVAARHISASDIRDAVHDELRASVSGQVERLPYVVGVEVIRCNPQVGGFAA